MTRRAGNILQPITKWYLNQSVFSKVLFVTLVLLILSVLIGITGMAGTFRINQIVNEIIDRNMLPALYLYEIKVEMTDLQSEVRNGIIKGDPEEISYLSSTFINNKKEMIRYYTQQLRRLIAKDNSLSTTRAIRLNKLNRFNRIWPNNISLYKQILNEYSMGTQGQSIQTLKETAKQLAFTIGILDELILDFKTDAVNAKQQSNIVYKGVINCIWITLTSAICVGLLLSCCFGRFLSNQLQGFATLARQIADGNLNTKINFSQQKDEIGRLGESFNRMHQNLYNILGKISMVTKSIVQHSQKLDQGAQQTVYGATKVVKITDQIFNGSSDQSRQIEEMLQSLEESMVLNKGTIQSVQNTIDISNTASNSAITGKATAMAVKNKISSIQNTIETNRNTVHQMATVTLEIDKVMRAIAEVADQINLLALNATIEAARAGEEGRGFTIVAEAISQLSDRTQELVKGVQRLAKNTRQETLEVIEAIDQSAEEFTVGNQLASQLSETFLEIAKDIVEIQKHINLVSENAKESEGHGRQILSGMQKVAAIARQNEGETQHLKEFTQIHNTFTNELRALANQLMGTGNTLNQTMMGFNIDNYRNMP
ncbi:MAG TPA: methyl-accepting chemotaxis protein [Bacillota bacterium]|nr:methyl-accepting chemotaxis protein [Bacillota bacterium]